MKLTSKINWTLEIERQEGHYGDSYKLAVKGKKANFEAFISAGLSDKVAVYRDSDFNIYVLSQNSVLDYIGLEVFNSIGEDIGNIFFQNAWELDFNPFDYSDVYNIKALNSYIYG